MITNCKLRFSTFVFNIKDLSKTGKIHAIYSSSRDIYYIDMLNIKNVYNIYPESSYNILRKLTDTYYVGRPSKHRLILSEPMVDLKIISKHDLRVCDGSSTHCMRYNLFI